MIFQASGSISIRRFSLMRLGGASLVSSILKIFQEFVQENIKELLVRNNREFAYPYISVEPIRRATRRDI